MVTNLATPFPNWIRILTHQFDVSGNYSVTNGSAPNSQSYYRLEVP
jgi:hypothetical protein